MSTFISSPWHQDTEDEVNGRFLSRDPRPLLILNVRPLHDTEEKFLLGQATSLIGAKIMARRKISDTALVVLVAMIGGPIWLFQNYPVLAVVLGAIFISGFIQYSRCRVCEVCGVVLKRVVYLWEINGQSKRVCPICNRTLERRQSNRALRNL